MYLIMFLIIGVYVYLVTYIARILVKDMEAKFDVELRKAEKTHNNILRKREDSFKNKRKLEEESLEIFTLYEIAKEITTSLTAKEAFGSFEAKLREYISFSDCRYLDAGAPERKDYEKAQEYFVFLIQAKKRKIGYVVIKNLKDDDKDKAIILCNQFGLALERVNLYQEIEKIAITDSLTDVHTRRYTMERFQEEIRRSKSRKRKMSFLMIDVDFFKRFNDKYGHLTGDKILGEVAKIIKDNIREIDIPGRYGGEEFCVILPDTDRAGAQYVSERIRHAAETTEVKAYNTKGQVTLSIGTATFPMDGKSVSELIDKADWALYRAKKQGRNRVCSFGVYSKK